MGEIKSTLDLVMEKTRHMTMSRKERDAQIAEENRGKISGLIQKYVDGLLRKEKLLEDLDRLQRIETQSNRQLLLREGLDRIELEGTPDAVLELLAFGCGVNVEPLADVRHAYAEQKRSLQIKRTNEFRQHLAAERKISGSAVVPNLPGDPAYTESLAGLKDRYTRLLEKEKSLLRV